jgi:hypothetical protein
MNRPLLPLIRLHELKGCTYICDYAIVAGSIITPMNKETRKIVPDLEALLCN